MKDWIWGTGVAIITPFTAEGAVDDAALRRIVNHLIEGQVDYLVVLGTTGEAATLHAEEKHSVIQTVIDTNAGRLPIVIGVGGNNTADAVQQISAHQDAWDLQGFLSVSPYYNKPTQKGIYQHYAAIAQASKLPVILYNVPGRTASNMTASTTLRLAHDFENIIAIKEASGDLGQCMEIIQNKPSGFELISGDDYLTIPMISIGAVGVISVAANAFPGAFSELVDCALRGDFEEARTHHYNLFSLMNLNFAEGNPAGVKVLMEFQAICSKHVRLPLVSASDELIGLMKTAWKEAFQIVVE